MRTWPACDIGHCALNSEHRLRSVHGPSSRIRARPQVSDMIGTPLRLMDEPSARARTCIHTFWHSCQCTALLHHILQPCRPLAALAALASSPEHREKWHCARNVGTDSPGTHSTGYVCDFSLPGPMITTPLLVVGMLSKTRAERQGGSPLGPHAQFPPS